MMTEKLSQIPLSRLHPHPHNPRGTVNPDSLAEMAASITEKGILEPLLVVPSQSDQQGFLHYLIIAGHRRAAAARLAGLEAVPCIQKILSQTEQEEVMLVENLQREDLSLLQEARAYQRLIEQGLTSMDLARRTGAAPQSIHERLLILQMAPGVQELFEANQLPVTAIRPLSTVTSHERQTRLARRVASFQLTVRELKEIVSKLSSEGLPTPAPKKPRALRTAAPVAFSRAEEVKALQNSNRTWHARDILTALDGICGHCGMSGFAAICGTCPLPQFLHQLGGQP